MKQKWEERGLLSATKITFSLNRCDSFFGSESFRLPLMKAWLLFSWKSWIAANYPLLSKTLFVFERNLINLLSFLPFSLLSTSLNKDSSTCATTRAWWERSWECLWVRENVSERERGGWENVSEWMILRESEREEKKFFVELGEEPCHNFQIRSEALN